MPMLEEGIWSSKGQLFDKGLVLMDCGHGLFLLRFPILHVLFYGLTEVSFFLPSNGSLIAPLPFPFP